MLAEVLQEKQIATHTIHDEGTGGMEEKGIDRLGAVQGLIELLKKREKFSSRDGTSGGMNFAQVDELQAESLGGGLKHIAQPIHRWFGIVSPSGGEFSWCQGKRITSVSDPSDSDAHPAPRSFVLASLSCGSAACRAAPISYDRTRWRGLPNVRAGCTGR